MTHHVRLVISTACALFITLCCLLNTAHSRVDCRKRVAVFDFKVADSKGGKPITDEVRVDVFTETLSSSITELQTYYVFTKDNIRIVLENNPVDCIGKCDIDTEKKLQAHYILNGQIDKLELTQLQ